MSVGNGFDADADDAPMIAAAAAVMVAAVAIRRILFTVMIVLPG
ncbi:MAG: hypothetical protein ACLP8S_08235 [Solirubrobacteraceae bacterium]